VSVGTVRVKRKQGQQIASKREVTGEGPSGGTLASQTTKAEICILTRQIGKARPKLRVQCVGQRGLHWGRGVADGDWPRRSEVWPVNNLTLRGGFKKLEKEKGVLPITGSVRKRGRGQVAADRRRRSQVSSQVL